MSHKSCGCSGSTGGAFRQSSARLSPAPRQKGVINTSNKKEKEVGKEEGKEENEVTQLTAARALPRSPCRRPQKTSCYLLPCSPTSRHPLYTTCHTFQQLHPCAPPPRPSTPPAHAAGRRHLPERSRGVEPQRGLTARKALRLPLA